MRHFQLFLVLALLINSCSIAGDGSSAAPINKKHLVVLVYDISASVDAVAVLNRTHLEMLYTGLGHHGGGKVFGLQITVNSRKQDPIFTTGPELEQLTMKGNTYQRANRRKLNSRMQKQFEEGKSEFVETLDKLIQPKKAQFSDVENALLLAKQITEMPAFADWYKHVVIISDLENDRPPIDGMDRMNPVRFKDGTDVSIVRPSTRVNLSEALGGGPFAIQSTIDDALASIFTLNEGMWHGK